MGGQFHPIHRGDMPHSPRKGCGLVGTPGGGDVLPELDVAEGLQCVSEAQLFLHG